MTIATALLSLTTITLTIALLLTQRQQQAQHDRLITLLVSERASADHRIGLLLEAHNVDRATPNPDTVELIGLVERMAQRIQAPEQAIVDHGLAQPLPPSPPAIPFDDDDAYWDAQEPVTKEALAEALMATEVHA